jgi:hypothetical protein
VARRPLDLRKPTPEPRRWCLLSIDGASTGFDSCGLCGGRRLYQEMVDIGVGQIPVAPVECLNCGAQALDWRCDSYTELERAVGWSPAHPEDWVPPFTVDIFWLPEPRRHSRPIYLEPAWVPREETEAAEVARPPRRRRRQRQNHTAARR